MAVRPPRIGINCDSFADPQTRQIGLREPYVRAILDAGAVPVLVPFLDNAAQVAALLDVLDGFVLTGGDDLRAERLGLPNPPGVTVVLPERDRSDFLLIEALLARPLPTLAICLGLQELNVHLGGTIYQDLASERPASGLDHGQGRPGGSFLTHSLRIATANLLCDLWSGATDATVSSNHHQGIRDLGRGLAPVAWAPDGLIEAAILPEHPFLLAVQWHPERQPDDPLQQALFAALVSRAAAAIG